MNKRFMFFDISCEYCDFNSPNAAPGYRRDNTGMLGTAGYYGSSWSSAISVENGMSLRFYTAWLVPSSDYSRAYGFQLRCLSE
ncbi:hypothetical protein [uncultured Rikenella sp.]|uniref:hypothetical protein n=1 Tax=uncultured Rikenella sp. TaxID=368003 RepID=UPI0025EAC903|nr:hypothetical protein [uncultured Rikenella sp.]